MQNLVGLAKLLAFVDEFSRRGCIEFKHIEMTWDDELRLNISRQLGSFGSEQIAGNTPFRRPPIDWKERKVDPERPQFL